MMTIASASRGMTFAKSPAKLKLAMPEILENTDSNLTPRMRNLVAALWTKWKSLDEQIKANAAASQDTVLGVDRSDLRASIVLRERECECLDVNRSSYGCPRHC